MDKKNRNYTIQYLLIVTSIAKAGIAFSLCPAAPFLPDSLARELSPVCRRKEKTQIILLCNLLILNVLQ